MIDDPYARPLARKNRGRSPKGEKAVELHGRTSQHRASLIDRVAEDRVIAKALMIDEGTYHEAVRLDMEERGYVGLRDVYLTAEAIEVIDRNAVSEGMDRPRWIERELEASAFRCAHGDVVVPVNVPLGLSMVMERAAEGLGMDLIGWMRHVALHAIAADESAEAVKNAA